MAGCMAGQHENPHAQKMDLTFPRANLSWHRHSKTRFNVEASIVGIFFATSQIIPGSFFLLSLPLMSGRIIERGKNSRWDRMDA